MIPVSPPAAMARSNTEGNQSFRKVMRRSSGDAFTIARGENDLNVETGDFVTIKLYTFLTRDVALRRDTGQRGYPQLPPLQTGIHGVRNYSLARALTTIGTTLL
jgi:hypothetical protein